MSILVFANIYFKQSKIFTDDSTFKIVYKIKKKTKMSKGIYLGKLLLIIDL